MVAQRYLLAKRQAPSSLKQAFDQRILPRVIDAAASLEAPLERFAWQVRDRPVMHLGVAFCVGLLTGLCTFGATRRG